MNSVCSIGAFKSEEQIDALARAQEVTEKVMEMACSLIARCEANSTGELLHDGGVLTSERMKAEIAKYLLDFGFTMEMAPLWPQHQTLLIAITVARELLRPKFPSLLISFPEMIRHGIGAIAHGPLYMAHRAIPS